MLSKSTVLALVVAVMQWAVPGSVMAASQQELNEMYDDLNKKYKSLERKVRANSKKNRKTDNAFSEFAERLKVHGFISAGVAVGRDEKADFHPDYLHITDEPNFVSDSTIGLQFDFKVRENWNAVVQVKSDLGEEDELSADWAFLQYDNRETGWNAKFGRFRLPLYYYSQFLDVGFAYPWVRPPSVLYWVPFSTYDGLDISYQWNWKGAIFKAHLMDGQFGGPWAGNEWDFQTETFVVLEMNIGNHDFKFIRTSSEVETDYGDSLATTNAALAAFGLPALSTESRIRYRTLSYAYDNGKLISNFEVSSTDIMEPDFPDAYLFNGTRNGAYWMIGYRFGKWLPSITFSKLFTDEDRVKATEEYRFDPFEQQLAFLGSVPPETVIDPGTGTTAGQAIAGINGLMPRIAFGNFKQQSITLSTAYTVNSRVVIKGEVQRFSDFGTGNPYSLNGDFNTDPDNPNFYTEIDRTQWIYSLAIDAVF